MAIIGKIGVNRSIRRGELEKNAPVSSRLADRWVVGGKLSDIGGWRLAGRSGGRSENYPLDGRGRGRGLSRFAVDRESKLLLQARRLLIFSTLIVLPRDDPPGRSGGRPEASEAQPCRIGGRSRGGRRPSKLSSLVSSSYQGTCGFRSAFLAKTKPRFLSGEQSRHGCLRRSLRVESPRPLWPRTLLQPKRF